MIRDLSRRAAVRGVYALGAAALETTVLLALAAITAHLAAQRPEGQPVVDVVFVRQAPRPPAPPPPPPAAARRAPTSPRAVLVRRPSPPAALIQPREVAPEIKMPDPGEPVEEYDESGVEGGVVGGVPGGVPGGVIGGSLEGYGRGEAPQQVTSRKFDNSMTPPVLVSGPKLEYTQQALEREVEGVMVVECVVAVDGAVHGCRVLRSLPFMDRAVVENLERRRYKPATLGGKPLDVQYTFTIRLRLPE